MHKDFSGVSDNPLGEVSVYLTNPTGFSVQTIPCFFSPIRPRFGVYGNHLFSVIIAVKGSKRLRGVFGGFLRKSRLLVLGMSACAYQEGRFVSSGPAKRSPRSLRESQAVNIPNRSYPNRRDPDLWTVPLTAPSQEVQRSPRVGFAKRGGDASCVPPSASLKFGLK